MKSLFFSSAGKSSGKGKNTVSSSGRMFFFLPVTLIVFFVNVELLWSGEFLLSSQNPVDRINNLEMLAKDTPDDPRIFYEIGAALMELSEYDRAKNYFEKALALEPRYNAPYQGLMTLAVRKNDIDAARRIVFEHRKRSPRGPNMLAMIAAMKEIEGKTKEALALYKRAVKDGTSYDRPYFIFAEMLYGNNEAEKALVLLNTGYGIAHNPAMLSRASEIAMESNLEEMQIRALRNLRVTRDYSLPVFYNLAGLQKSLYRKSMPPNTVLASNALSDINAALSINPADLPSRQIRAELYYILGMFEEAKKDVDFVLKRNPDSSYALMVRAALALSSRDYSKALECYRKLEKLEPDNRYHLYQQAHVLRLMKREKEAEKVMKRAEKRFPLFRKAGPAGSDADGREQKIGKSVEADRLLKKIDREIASRPGESEPLVMKGQLLYELERYNEALKILKEVIKREPSNAAALQALVKVYSGLGLFAEAKLAASALVRVEPKKFYSRYLYGQALANAGMIPHAIAQFEIALSYAMNKSEEDAARFFLEKIRRQCRQQ